LYQAYRAGQPSPLAPLLLQYADYALWQRQWLQGKVLETQLDYWTRQLGGVSPIELPIDYVRPSVSSSRGAVHSFVLSEDLSQALITVSRKLSVTLFMTLLAAFQVLFYRYTGQTDIVIGSDSANRNHLETEGIIGFFVNLLVLRGDLSGDPSFQEVLGRVRSMVLAAYTYGDTPFDLLVEKLAPDHHLEYTPLIQVLFVLQNIPKRAEEVLGTMPQRESKAVEPPSLDTDMAALDQETVAKFDISLFMQEHAGKLFGRVEYRRDLFQASTIATMISRFITLLQSCVSQPDVSIDLLDMVSEAERQQREQEEQKRRKTLNARNDVWLDLSSGN
jgi:non-ribosomal peptide synthetase component F